MIFEILILLKLSAGQTLWARPSCFKTRKAQGGGIAIGYQIFYQGSSE